MSDDAIINLLGYLKPVTWASAIFDFPEHRDRFFKLMREQEKEYGLDLVTDVEYLLNDSKAYKLALKENK